MHGDDYVSTGMPSQLQWMKIELEKKFQVKTQILGPEQHRQQEVKILNRLVQWDGARGFVYEADPRHAELTIEQLGFRDAKIVSTPGTKEEGRTQDDSKQKLKEADATRKRAIVARCNYLALDRPDIVFAAKELARQMSSPTQGGGLDEIKEIGPIFRRQAEATTTIRVAREPKNIENLQRCRLGRVQKHKKVDQWWLFGGGDTCTKGVE